MAENKTWYSAGYSALNQEEQRMQSFGGQARRFWMKPEESRDFVFADDEPLCLHEHNPKLNGSFQNWFTCLTGIAEENPCCEVLGNNSRYFVGYYTIVNCHKSTDTKGNVYQYELQLLPAKIKTLKKLRRKKEERKSLVGLMFRATREDGKSPSVGDEFEFQREVDTAKLFELVNYRGKKLTDLFAQAEANPESMEKLKKIFQLSIDSNGKLIRRIPAFNYFEMLKPKSPKEIREMLEGVKLEEQNNFSDKGGGGGEKPSGGADESVPF